MLVSHEKKFIYLKCGKTASTSTEAFLQAHCGDSELRLNVTQVSTRGIISHPFRPLPGTLFHAHMPARELKPVLGERVWSDYFKFANVRNPFDAVVSAYFDQKAYYPGNPSFEEWWRRWSAYDFIWSVIEIDDCLAVDGIVRYENLFDDLDRICRRLDIGFDRASFPRERAQERPAVGGLKIPYQEVIPSVEIAEEIAHVFARTLGEFGYRY
ncbi:MAG: sulfotransferase family 2 domain-containing protein [Acidobacteriota bacterium]